MTVPCFFYRLNPGLLGTSATKTTLGHTATKAAAESALATLLALLTTLLLNLIIFFLLVIGQE